MKAFRNKVTGRLGETQFSEDADILVRNAKQYYPNEEIEIIAISPTEYTELIKTQNINNIPKEQKDELKIQAEIRNILREQAITNLKTRGEL